MPHKLLTVAEFAETLGVSPRTVAREINDGAITVVQVRGSVRIDPADAAYQALLESVGGSGSQGLRESIEAAFAAGFEVDAPPGGYWPEEEIYG